MTDKELAEEVAGYLGWVKGNYENGSQIINWETFGEAIVWRALMYGCVSCCDIEKRHNIEKLKLEQKQND